MPHRKGHRTRHWGTPWKGHWASGWKYYGMEMGSPCEQTPVKTVPSPFLQNAGGNYEQNSLPEALLTTAAHPWSSFFPTNHSKLADHARPVLAVGASFYFFLLGVGAGHLPGCGQGSHLPTWSGERGEDGSPTYLASLVEIDRVGPLSNWPGVSGSPNWLARGWGGSPTYLPGLEQGWAPYQM